MKSKMLTTKIIMFIGISLLFSEETKTEKFKVYGNCGMCETRIEKAATSLDGVSKAEWDKKTGMIKITFDEEKVTLDDIHKAIAKAGHDTDKVKAEDDVYANLHGCCKYERPEKD